MVCAINHVRESVYGEWFSYVKNQMAILKIDYGNGLPIILICKVARTFHDWVLKYDR